jgi:hypothetical protein
MVFSRIQFNPELLRFIGLKNVMMLPLLEGENPSSRHWPSAT